LEGIQRMTSLPVQLKWPNDVLVRGKKVSGVLAEAAYNGDRLDYIVLGMGVNVNGGPPSDLQLDYETASLAGELGRELDRDALVRSILAAFAMRYPYLGTPALAEAWSGHLAMRGQPVRVVGITETITGVLEGVKGDGALVVRTNGGEIRTILAGDVHLRKV
jgi:BirA family biotin operon repressor/biotin-[acetyl-CoA-carboxylase] ligase